MTQCILFLIIQVLISISLSSKQITVCKTCELKSIQKAVMTAQSDDEIYLQSGIYFESNIVIDKELKLIGVNDPVVDGTKNGNIFIINSDNVSIQSIVIRNSGIGDLEEFAGIYIKNVRNCIIKNNKIINTAYAIYLSKSKECLISQNKISGNLKSNDEATMGNGIHLWNSGAVKIEKNQIEGHRDGLYFEFSNYLSISENVSKRNIRYGMHFMYCDWSKFLNNLFENNITGVAIMYSNHIQIEDNSFENNWGSSSLGILFKEINYSQILRNQFIKNKEGILLDSSSFNHFEGNLFTNNGFAVRLYGNCEGNQIVKNNFISNIFDVSTNTRESRNTFESNYWSGYEGYDLDNNNSGDVPFHPVKAFSYWIETYPELVILLDSPVVKILEIAERIFPILSPVMLLDRSPSLEKL